MRDRDPRGGWRWGVKLAFFCAGVVAGGLAPGARPAAAAEAPAAIRIAKIWSDQFPGVAANFLPAEPDTGKGPGDPRKTYILMGERDGKGRVKARLELDPPASPLTHPVFVGLVNLDRTNQPLAGDVVAWQGPGMDVSLATDLEPDPPVNHFRVIAWIDLDGDHQYSPDKGEIRVSAPGDFRIVSQAAYDRQVALLKKVSALFTGQADQPASGFLIDPGSLPITGDFLAAFVTGGAPSLAAGAESNRTICANGELTHNVGVAFGPEGCGPVFEYRFASDSLVSRAILESLALRKAVLGALASGQSRIQEEFGRADVETLALPIGVLNAASGRYARGVTFEVSEDNDLALAFASVTLSDAEVIVNRSQPDAVEVRGVVTDLYDFDDDAPLGNLGAVIQAGYGTLGPGGRVFYLRAEIAGTADSIRWDGQSSLRLRWVGNGGSRRLQLEATGLPGTRLAVESATDLKTWRPFQEVVLADGVATIALAASGGDSAPRYFRARVLPSGP